MELFKIKEISKVDWGNTKLTKKAYVENEERYFSYFELDRQVFLTPNLLY